MIRRLLPGALFALVLLVSAVGNPAELVAAPCKVALLDQDHTVVEVIDVGERFAGMQERLRRGLRVTLMHQLAYEDGKGSHRFQFGCQVIYDLWEETYFITPVIGSVTVGARRESVKKWDGPVGACVRARLPFSMAPGSDIRITSLLNPISEQQLEKTREWLASRGIGSSSGALVGRAVGAMMDLDQHDEYSRTCVLERMDRPQEPEKSP